MNIGDNIIIKIDEDNKLLNLLELEQINLDSYENLFVNFVLDKNIDETNQINLNDFMEKYNSQFRKTNSAKKNFTKYLLEEVDDLKNYEFNWNVNFYDNSVRISITGKVCECNG